MRQHLAAVWIALIVCLCAGGCFFGGKPKSPADGPGSREKGRAGSPVALTPVDLSDAVRPGPIAGAVQLTAAKNEWASFVLQIGPRMPGATYTLRLGEFRNTTARASVPASNIEAYQVLSMPVDANRAGYVRHTGQETARGVLPRALLPMPRDAGDGSINLGALRDASRPTDPAAVAPAAEPALVWVDMHIPDDAPAGEYVATCDAVFNGSVVSSVPLKLTVLDFALPSETHLQLVGRLEWDDLERLYPDRFEAIRPRLMNRSDAAYTGAVRVIDSLLALAHRHRTSVTVPRLQPTVKWPPNAPPQVLWEDFDSLVAPWMSGDAFEDKRPIGFWPMPAPDLLDRYVRPSQLEYWANAATHFDQNDWLDRAPVWVEKVTPGPATDADAAELSRSAAELLAIHQRVRAMLPLESDQLLIREDNADAGRLDPASTSRLWSAASGLVFAPPARLWPESAQPPMHYLRSDMPALVPYVGAGGDERDVRLWAWLAFLRSAGLINFSDALPSLTDPTDAADPNELIWFYPGEWFGLAEPVPTIQLKWLRRAQQDFEYLWLARQRGSDDRDTRLNTLLMAQLITKPVEIQPGQYPDPAYALMSGTTSQSVWDEAQRLLADTILLHSPGQAVDEMQAHRVQIRTLRWAEPQERPILMGRTTEWQAESKPPELWLHLKLGVDIYNASATTPAENLLGWTGVPRASGWEIETRPVPVPVLQTYNVKRATLDARFDLDKVTPAARQPVELTFTNGYNNRTASLKLVLPVATSDRREGRLSIDGRLDDDWDQADLVQNGPLVKMLSRPGLQQQSLEYATTPSRIYTSWAAENFYVAFDVSGISPSGGMKAQNFVDYQFRRAWSEDLCEILIQPVSIDGTPGPVLHVVCKPNGSSWVERKNPGDSGAKAWQEVEGRVFYVSRQEADQWQGEVRIPWRAILDAAAAGARDDAAEPPALLRFNFVQHRTSTGESASWSGPIDFGRDDSFMGVLYLRDPQEPGPRNIAGSGTRLRASPQER